MSYLGNTPAARFSAMAKQTITGDGGTGYTLTHAVGNEQEIEVFVNNVRQEPGSGKAYTVSGTTLTMTGNVASTDDFYVVYQGKAQQTATHPPTFPLTATTGTFSSTLAVTGITTATGGLNVGTIKDAGNNATAMTIDSDGVVKITQNPCFFITGNNSAHVNTTPVVFATTVIDTRSGVDLANNKYVIPVAGKWHFHVQLGIVATEGTGNCYPIIRRTPSGGSAVDLGYSYFNPVNAAGVTSYTHIDVDAIADCVVGDAITVPFSQVTSTYFNGSNECRFFGYFLG